MAYTPQTWHDAPATDTPMSAARLGVIEAGIAAATTGQLLPVRVATTGAETYTIAAGSVTQIAGTSLDGVTCAVGDRILITTAPAASGAGTQWFYTTQPANGIYTVTNATTNLTVSRAADCSGANNPIGMGVFVKAGNVWGQSGWWVTTPTTGAFTYGTTAMQWTTLVGLNPHLGTAYFSSIWLYLNGAHQANLVNNAAAVADQTITLPATTTDTLVGRADIGTGPGGSGFPLRLPGEKVVAVAQEVARLNNTSTTPAGTKIVVLAEAWDTPGKLTSVWIVSGDDTGFAEQGGVIRIYVDNSATPVVSMSLGDFFMHSNHSDIFTTPRVGRTARSAGASGANGSAAYRHLYMPFQKYLRVEVENTLATEGAFYAKAEYSTTTAFADFGSQQLAYSLVGLRNNSLAKQTAVTVCDLNGAGQVESLLVTFHGADNGDAAILEGNISIYVDNELYPSWSSSGMEDAFDGGWYVIPIGGWPSGRAGNSDLSGTNMTMYRFFLTSPVYFTSHLKVVVNAGQVGQGTPVSATVQFASYVGLWQNTPTTPNYTVPDLVATATRDEQMNDTAGVVPTARWLQQGDRTQWAATGTTYKILPGNTGPDQDARLACTSLTPPANFWLEGRVRINTAQTYTQEVYILALGSSPDPYYGSAIHVGINRVSASSWVVLAKDSFDQVFLNQIGGGADLLNVWVRVAIKKIGTRVTAYYSMNPSPSPWLPLGTWTPAQTGTAVGIATWTAGAEVDYLTMRPLKTVTS